MKFCTRCGLSKKMVFVDGFNSQTGKRNTRWTCQNKNCFCYCIQNFGSHSYVTKGFWFMTCICSRCGYENLDD